MHPNPTRRVRSRIALGLATAVALTTGLGCGIGQSFSDGCLRERRALGWAQAKESGFRNRGLPPKGPMLTAASEQVRRISAELTACELNAG